MVRHTGENFLDEECIAVTSVLALQSTCINDSELDTPEAEGLPGYSYAAFGQEILDIPVTQIEAIVEPDGITDDVGWESVTFVCIHRLMLPVMATLLGSTECRSICNWKRTRSYHHFGRLQQEKNSAAAKPLFI